MQAIRMVVQLQHAGMLTVPSGAQVIRFLPPLNLQPAQAQEALNIFDKVLGSLASAQ
jgi:acetylornithine/succinyldiaminopimelate/putrescine aminotransferase